MNRLFLLACAAFLVAGCETAPGYGRVEYRVSGSSKSVVLNSMWWRNSEVRPANPYLNLPWRYEFDGVPDLHLGLSVTKWDTGSVHVRVFVNNQLQAHDSIRRADIGGTLDIEVWWP